MKFFHLFIAYTCFYEYKEESVLHFFISNVVYIFAKILLNSNCRAPTVFFSSSDESSWKKATDLLVEVASHGEDTGYEVPCLIVAAKDDLDPFPLAIQDSTRVNISLYVPMAVVQTRHYGRFHISTDFLLKEKEKDKEILR